MFKITKDKHEILNTISHALGVILGFAGLIVLLIKDRSISSYSTLSIFIFSGSMILLYTSSTLYHLFADEKIKNRARVLDHISIFLLIAGTYTPICLITLEKTSGWTLFFIVWSIAAAGIIMKLFLTGKLDKFSLFLYLIMGWIVVFDIRSIFDLMTFQALIFLVLGGISYTIGTIFYAKETIPYSHFIWHLFVLGGSAFHFAMVYTIV